MGTPTEADWKKLSGFIQGVVVPAFDEFASIVNSTPGFRSELKNNITPVRSTAVVDVQGRENRSMKSTFRACWINGAYSAELIHEVADLSPNVENLTLGLYSRTQADIVQSLLHQFGLLCR